MSVSSPLSGACTRNVLAAESIAFAPAQDIVTPPNPPNPEWTGATRSEVITRAVEHRDARNAAADMTHVPDQELEQVIRGSRVLREREEAREVEAA